MRVYRIESRDRSADPLTGIGAELYGGRWNQVGQRAVYCATYRSLAMLEILVHVSHRAIFPANRVMITLDLPEDELPLIKASQLPKGWDDLTSYHKTERVFNQRCKKKGLLGLRLPSVIVHEEFNVILDPEHPKFDQVKIIERKPIEWDKRLL